MLAVQSSAWVGIIQCRIAWLEQGNVESQAEEAVLGQAAPQFNKADLGEGPSQGLAGPRGITVRQMHPLCWSGSLWSSLVLF